MALTIARVRACCAGEPLPDARPSEWGEPRGVKHMQVTDSEARIPGAEIDRRRRFKVNPIVGSLPVLQYCAPEQLLIDDSYQRSLEATNRARRWSGASPRMGLGAVPALVRRPARRWRAVRRRRPASARRCGACAATLPSCRASSATFDSADREAAAFVQLNQQRRPLDALDLFKAALASGDPTATLIKQCLEDAGLELANSTNNQTMKAGQVGNVGGLQRCERTYGAAVLRTALKVLALAYPQQVLRYAGSIFPGIVAVVAGELHNRAAPTDLVPRLAGFVGRDAQSEWVHRFAQAKADDVNLKHSQAAERVLRAAWVEYSQARHGLPPAPKVEQHDPGGCAPPVYTVAPTFLKPAETAWCDQCDRQVSGARAAKCASKFCKLKVAA
jgi:hypothetical protein